MQHQSHVMVCQKQVMLHLCYAMFELNYTVSEWCHIFQLRYPRVKFCYVWVMLCLIYAMSVLSSPMPELSYVWDFLHNENEICELTESLEELDFFDFQKLLLWFVTCFAFFFNWGYVVNEVIVAVASGCVLPREQ